MNDIIQVLASGLLMGLVYALIALGLTLIWGVVEIVNFSHGDFMMIAMYLAFTLYSFLHLDPLLSLPLVVIAMGLIGIATHKLLIRPVLKAPMLAQIFITFGLMIFLRGLAQFIWGPNYRVIPKVWVAGSAAVGPIHLGWPQLMAGLGAVLGTIGVTWFVHHTETGRGLRATAEDRETAGLMGIDPDRMFAWTWAIGIGSLGIAGALLSNFFYIFPEVGGVFGLIAFVTVALGGFGSVGGAFVAGIIIGLVQVLAGFFINPAIKDIPVFSIYLLIVILRPQGLLGKF